MSTGHFERTIGEIAATLGDPTRRGIYVSVREADGPATVARTAAAFDIHPNVARHHLDRLVDDGYLVVASGRPAGEGAGRPAKHYTASDKQIALSYPPRRYDLLADLLVQVIEQIDPDGGPDAAEEVGRAYGRRLAVETGITDAGGSGAALEAVSQALLGVGFGTTAQPGTLVTHHCPFGRTAAEHPEVVCRLDQGIVSGLLEAARTGDGSVVMNRREGPDDACVADI
jgi:predicted ArsR family transcriptional regulator